MSRSFRKLHLATILQEGHGFKLHKKLLTRKANKVSSDERLELIADCPLLLTAFSPLSCLLQASLLKKLERQLCLPDFQKRSAPTGPAAGCRAKPAAPRRAVQTPAGTALLPQHGYRAEGWRRKKAGTRETDNYSRSLSIPPLAVPRARLPASAALPSTPSTEPTLSSSSAAAHMGDVIDITPPPRSRPNARPNGNRPAPRAWPRPCPLKESWRGVVFVVGSGFSYVRGPRVLLTGLAQLHPSDSYTLAEKWLQRGVQHVWPHSGDSTLLSCYETK